MSLYHAALNVGSPPRNRLQLAAHTDAASALSESLLCRQISQPAYEAQVYSTCITTTDRARSVPIILSLDDNLHTLIVYAFRAFNISPTKALARTTKMYVLWSEKTFHAMGAHSVPENLMLLDQETLKMILTFMKASTQVEQLLVDFGEGLIKAEAESMSTAMEVDQAEAEDDDTTLKNQPSATPNVVDRSSTKGKERSASRQGKDRENFLVLDQSGKDSIAGYQRKLNLLAQQNDQRLHLEKQKNMQQEPEPRLRVAKQGAVLPY